MNFKFQKGFTLIEMIIVFSVISILSTIAIASFVGYNKVQVLQIAASDLSSTLALAKSQALSQTAKPSQCVTPLDGFQVVLSIANNTYELDAVCTKTAYPIRSFKLPGNVSFDGSPKTTSTSFLFPVIVNGVQGAGTISLSAYGKTKTITVDSMGAIK